MLLFCIAKAADHAVGGALLLHLDHRPFARAIFEIGALGDDTVERATAALQPGECRIPVARHRRQLQAGYDIRTEEVLQLLAAFGERHAGDRLSAVLEQVEDHELCRSLLGKLANATFGRMQTQLQCLERQSVAAGDDQLPVDQELLRLQAAQHLSDLGKIARKRLARLGSQRDLIAIAPGEAAETIPLWLVLPTLPLRQLGSEQRLHRRGNN